MKSFVNGYLENAVIPLELTSDLRALGDVIISDKRDNKRDNKKKKPNK